MTIYAQIVNGLVINVIVADQDFISTLQNKNDYKILTRGGIGWTYDETSDVFIAPKPYASWLLNGSHDWSAPVAYPADGKIYVWDEAFLNWIIQN
jgi:hypothetical protein